jgi:hypothetical protein
LSCLTWSPCSQSPKNRPNCRQSYHFLPVRTKLTSLPWSFRFGTRGLFLHSVCVCDCPLSHPSLFSPSLTVSNVSISTQSVRWLDSRAPRTGVRVRTSRQNILDFLPRVAMRCVPSQPFLTLVFNHSPTLTVILFSLVPLFSS